MLRDFLDIKDDEISLEAASAMAVVLGEKPFTPEEKADPKKYTEIFKKVKEKVGELITKIKEFIQRIINWMKTKYYEFTKANTIDINQQKWNDGNTLLAKCDRFILMSLPKYFIVIKRQRKYTEDENSKLQNGVTSIIESEEFRRIQKEEYTGEHTISVKLDKFDVQKGTFEKAVKGLGDVVIELQKAMASGYTLSNVHNAALVYSLAMIRAIAVKIKVINSFMQSDKHYRTVRVV